ncbi:MAG: alpha/beta hydrolase family protein, partial [Methyloligellaceae bacterium]
ASLLCGLCGIALTMTLTPDANASERLFGVGFSSSSTADPMGGRMRYSLWYPTEVSDGVVSVGPFEFPGTWDAEPATGPFGLVVLSHGSGGSDLGHRDTGIALAKAGFIAAAPLHPRNNFRDDIHDDRRIVLDGRPRQLSAVIDALLAQEAWSSRIDSKKIAAFGFSAGGYTVLAALGAEREYARTLDHCERHAEEDPYCRIINGPGRAARVRDYADPAQSAFDGRLRAAVIADPFTAPFSDEALAAMPPAKLLFFRPEVEDKLTAEFHASRVVGVLRRRDDIPEPQEVLVPGAHHLSFLAPFPESVGRSLAGPEGFDAAAFNEEMTRRAALHEDMNRTIVTFFKQALSDGMEN